MAAVTTPPARVRLRLQVSGAVQGVGMRPFLYRSARGLGLDGWIRNDTRGVTLEMEGPEAALQRFADRVQSTPPPRAVVKSVAVEWLDPTGLAGLEILPSDAEGERLAAVLPDLATCPACLEDIGMTPGQETTDRRRGYPFTNCTDCGPRFSIIRALPYDRPNTTMAGFALCPACRAEYEDPMDRRFHAQPTACPACGPHLSRVDGVARQHGAGASSEAAEDPGGDHGTQPLDTDGAGWDLQQVRDAAEDIRRGRVVALKGLGGFHLVVDARNEAAVRQLRARKRRPTKPLAVMVQDLAMARSVVDVPEGAAALLEAPEAPIVLLRKKPAVDLAEAVAPQNPYLGVMLPYTPLHHLLMRELGFPVVATSGNLSDEPICIDEAEAAARLEGIADTFLVHDRPIERPVDDSVVQWVRGAVRPIRRSRGYAPLPVSLPAELPPVLAVGGHLKNTVALARGSDVFLSQHIGDLETPQARDAFERVIADFLRLYEVRPSILVHDDHPDYASTAWATGPAAEQLPGVERLSVQHHHAHLAACLADNAVEGPALGVIWDGTGLGPDGTIWGGEFLLGDAGGYRRVAHLRPFRLPGGDAAVKEPRRMALALMHDAWGDAGVERLRSGAGPSPMGWSAADQGILVRMLESGFRSPWTTSAGRLFDGVAALVGLRTTVGFEGEAAMALEYEVDLGESGSYPVAVRGAVPARAEEPPLIVDWKPAVEALLEDQDRGTPIGVMAARFHNGLVSATVAVAERVGMEQVALSGGCFQNSILTERTAKALEERGHRSLLHERVPANDGGLALGQVAVAAARTGL